MRDQRSSDDARGLVLRGRCRSHALDECRSGPCISPLSRGMASFPYGDDGDFRGVSASRGRDAGRLWRHLRPNSAPPRGDDTWPLRFVDGTCFSASRPRRMGFCGRALSGVGVGLSAGPSTAAILEFCGDQDPKRAASLTMTAQAGGLLPLALGGALAEYGPWPTRLCFGCSPCCCLTLLGRHLVFAASSDR